MEIIEGGEVVFLQAGSVDISTAKELIMGREHWLLLGYTVHRADGSRWYQMGLIGTMPIPEYPSGVTVLKMSSAHVPHLLASLNYLNELNVAPSEGGV